MAWQLSKTGGALGGSVGLWTAVEHATGEFLAAARGGRPPDLLSFGPGSEAWN